MQFCQIQTPRENGGIVRPCTMLIKEQVVLLRKKLLEIQKIMFGVLITVKEEDVWEKTKSCLLQTCSFTCPLNNGNVVLVYNQYKYVNFVC